MASLAKKSAWSAAGSMISVLGRLCSAVIVARLLGPRGVGQLAFLTWVCESMYVLSNRGLSSGLTRYIAELHGGGRSAGIPVLTKWVYKLCFVACVPGSAFLAAFLWFHGSTLHEYGSLLTCTILSAYVLTFFANVKIAEYTGMHRFRDLAVVNAISAIILIAGQFVGTIFLGLTGAVVGYALSSLPLALLVLWVINPMPRGEVPPQTLKRQFLNYSKNAWIGQIVSAVVWGRIEVFFIERYCGSHEVGLFSAALTLASIAIYGPVWLRGAFLPHFADLQGAGDRESIERAYITGTRVMALIAFPLGLGGAAIVPVLLPLLYGDAFASAAPMAAVLTGLACLTFGGVGSALVYGIGYSRFVALVEAAAAIASITASFLIIPSYGAWGAVWVRVGLQSTIILFQTLYISLGLKYRVPYGDILKTSCAAAACGAIAWGAVAVLPQGASIPLAVCLGAATYGVCGRLLGAIKTEDLQRAADGLRVISATGRPWTGSVNSFLSAVRNGRNK